jgi:hypothetical protein
MEVLIAVIFWIVPSVIVAFVAKKRGYSFWAYLLHGFLPSPFVALITLHLARKANLLTEEQPQPSL